MAVNDGKPSTSRGYPEDDPTDGVSYQLLRPKDDVFEVMQEYDEGEGQQHRCGI